MKYRPPGHESPILFSAPMVRAILAGAKTQTRRVLAPGHEDWEHLRKWDLRASDYGKYRPDDRLWVRESVWIDREPVTQFDPPHRRCFYDDGMVKHELDGSIGHCPHPTRPGVMKAIGLQKRVPSIHMPRWASRITLHIDAVRVERVSEISMEDALAEGVEYWLEHGGGAALRAKCSRIPVSDSRSIYPHSDFQILWDSINAKRGYAWASDPWVYVVTFHRI